ncbi:LUD domain-containing protein [Micromonospora sp. KC723]|uniref:LutC/YkgG family protein n=1 Tax=Micromonospora sp. KC723 TaxID=2530381 RepID=UPI001FB6AED0|nr:LUD domain-containing protein [Micromonospora sp. KC723]
MTARELILGRLRAALGGAEPAPVEVTRDYRGVGSVAADLDVFVDRLTDYRATVHRCGDADVARTVGAVLGGRRVVVPPGLPRHWLPDSVTAVPDDDLGVALVAAVDGVVTGAAVAVAETGTIVLDAAPDQGRRLITLLPDVHVCVLRVDQVVATVPDALARVGPHRPLTWISGPSATSDIELSRVEGVHGPRNLHVVLVAGDSRTSTGPDGPAARG